MPIVVDVGIGAPGCAVDIPRSEVAGEDADKILAGRDRGAAVAAMGEAFATFLTRFDAFDGIIGIGGGGGTSIITRGMRALPIGRPKLMVSTLASGDVSPFVDVSDITMTPSITDLAGLNSVSRMVLRNAAFAIAGMASARVAAGDGKPSIGLTMFGVTTPCVTRIVDTLRNRWDCLVFHATGTGGRTMEKLVDSDRLVGVIDVTTTEVCDHLLGGVLSAGPDRLGAIARRRLPYVGSVGALDMVNFWGLGSVPERFRGRNLHVHNPQVTLMRTTAEECRRIGALDRGKAERLRRPSPLSHSRERRIGAGRGRRRFFRSRSRRRAVRRAAAKPARDARPPAAFDCRSTSTIPRFPTRWSKTFWRSPRGRSEARRRERREPQRRYPTFSRFEIPIPFWALSKACREEKFPLGSPRAGVWLAPRTVLRRPERRAGLGRLEPRI